MAGMKWRVGREKWRSVTAAPNHSCWKAFIYNLFTEYLHCPVGIIVAGLLEYTISEKRWSHYRQLIQSRSDSIQWMHGFGFLPSSLLNTVSDITCGKNPIHRRSSNWAALHSQAVRHLFLSGSVPAVQRSYWSQALTSVPSIPRHLLTTALSSRCHAWRWHMDWYRGFFVKRAFKC